MTLSNIVVRGLAAYVLTTVVAKSHAMAWFRAFFRRTIGIPVFVLRSRRMKKVVWWERRQVPNETIRVTGYDFITCRLCLGMYVAWLTCQFAAYSLLDVLAVWGVSYALITCEKPV